MIDGGVEQQVAFLVANHLVDLNDPSPALIPFDLNGVNMGLDLGELAVPACADLIMSMDVAALHSVRSFDIWVHASKDRVNVAGVEFPIRAFQQVLLIAHVFSTPSKRIYSG